jgi:hypothetical protein
MVASVVKDSRISDGRGVGKKGTHGAAFFLNSIPEFIGGPILELLDVRLTVFSRNYLLVYSVGDIL